MDDTNCATGGWLGVNKPDLQELSVPIITATVSCPEFKNLSRSLSASVNTGIIIGLLFCCTLVTHLP